MKRMKKVLSVFFVMLIVGLQAKSFAKEAEQPVKWQVTVQHLGNDEFQLVAKAKMKPNFHIWALDAGGDGSLINTSIETSSEDELDWTDKTWKSNKQPKTETFEFIEGAVHYFENEVVFTRNFKVKEPVTSIKGTISYQSCNESMCFPPDDIPFDVQIKK